MIKGGQQKVTTRHKVSSEFFAERRSYAVIPIDRRGPVINGLRSTSGLIIITLLQSIIPGIIPRGIRVSYMREYFFSRFWTQSSRYSLARMSIKIENERKKRAAAFSRFKARKSWE